MAHGSTGSIMKDLADSVKEGYIAYPPFDGKEIYNNQILIGTYADAFVHHILSRLTGKGGLFSIRATKDFIAKIAKLNPDIIHIHNLHNSYINMKILFEYINTNSIPVVWTLHDSWAFTGQCTYYDLVQCQKWQTECHDCPQIYRYPKSWVDNTRFMYQLKNRMFSSNQNLYLVAPSKWISKQVSYSFLHNLPIQVINNGIDISIFHPTSEVFRKKHNLDHKYILLAVSNRWDTRKGVDFIAEISHIIDPEKAILVVVGKLTKSKQRLFSRNTIIIPTVRSKAILADIYSSADVFVNPTLEENFCLVNLEALSCGTPVVCFDSGGCSEVVNSECGALVYEKTSKAILSSLSQLKPKAFLSANCRKIASGYDKSTMIQRYCNLYQEILHERGIQ